MARCGMVWQAEVRQGAAVSAAYTCPYCSGRVRNIIGKRWPRENLAAIHDAACPSLRRVRRDD